MLSIIADDNIIMFTVLAIAMILKIPWYAELSCRGYNVTYHNIIIKIARPALCCYIPGYACNMGMGAWSITRVN